MESHRRPFGPVSASTARDTLEAVAGDRDRLAGRLRTPRWYYPTLAVLAAANAAAWLAPQPAAVIALALAGMVLLEQALRRVTGFSVNKPAGPRSLLVLIAMGVVVVSLTIGAILLGRAEDVGGGVAAAAGVLVAMLGGGLLYERVHAAELRDVRG
jgi:hypothetical protein